MTQPPTLAPPGTGPPPRPPNPGRPAGLLRRHRTLATALVATLVAALLAAGTLLAVRTLRGDGWRTVWSDDFDGRAGSPPSADWIVDTGTGYPGGAPQWGTGEVQRYTADPADLALDGDGHLRITPLRDPSGGWTSARVETRRDDFRPPAGGRLRVEARLRTPDGGPGYWAAFWMLGAPFRPAHTDWPGAGEIDVMEAIGSEPGTVHGTFHCGVWGGGPCKETTGLGAARTAGTPWSAAFHTYAVEWDRSGPVEQLRWSVDGTVFHTVRATDVDPATWARATDHGFFLLLNVAVGGGWPGPPGPATRSGAPMLVDRVSVAERR